MLQAAYRTTLRLYTCLDPLILEDPNSPRGRTDILKLCGQSTPRLIGRLFGTMFCGMGACPAIDSTLLTGNPDGVESTMAVHNGLQTLMDFISYRFSANSRHAFTIRQAEQAGKKLTDVAAEKGLPTVADQDLYRMMADTRLMSRRFPQSTLAQYGLLVLEAELRRRVKNR